MAIEQIESFKDPDFGPGGLRESGELSHFFPLKEILP
jgi:hypothetical protein